MEEKKRFTGINARLSEFSAWLKFIPGTMIEFCSIVGFKNHKKSSKLLVGILILLSMIDNSL